MNHTLIQNLALIMVVTLGLALTGNPLFVLGLLMLEELPYGLEQDKTRLAMMANQDDDDEPQPVGFTQDVKSKR